MARMSLDSALSSRRKASAALQGDRFDEVLGAAHCSAAPMQIVMLPIQKLYLNHKQRFRLLTEQELAELAYDIELCGLEHPITVRRSGDGYEVLAGRNRVRAFEKNGKTEIPAIIREADDAMAALIRNGNNLRQRQKIYPSEKAFAYKEQIDALRHQGKSLPPEIAAALGPLDQKLSSRQIIAKMNGVDENDVKRHLRLVCLNDELLELVDEGTLAVRAAVYLSYYDKATQTLIYEIFFRAKLASMNIKTAERLYKQLSPPTCEMGELKALMEKTNKPRECKTVRLTLPRAELERCFAEIPDEKTLAALFQEFLLSRRESCG